MIWSTWVLHQVLQLTDVAGPGGDCDRLLGSTDPSTSVWFDHVPLDVHVGSVAVRRFIEDRRPLLTLHGHIPESALLTGSWRER
jgi:hypothetical protein